MDSRGKAISRTLVAPEYSVMDIEDCARHEHRVSCAECSNGRARARVEGKVTPYKVHQLPTPAAVEVAHRGEYQRYNAVVSGGRVWLAFDHPWRLQRAFPDLPVPKQCKLFLSYVSTTGPVELTIQQHEVKIDPETDLLYYDLPRRLHDRAPYLPFVDPPLDSIVMICPLRPGPQGGWVRTFSLGTAGSLGPAEFTIQGRKVRLNVVSYDCDTEPGDCGAPILCSSGICGVHMGYDRKQNCNYFLPVTELGRRSLPLAGSESFSWRTVYGGWSSPRTAVFERKLLPKSAGFSTPVPAKSKLAIGVASERKKQQRKKPDVAAPKPEASIIQVTPSGSDYLGPRGGKMSSSDIVSQYVDMMVNPWGTSAVRLPDASIAPSALATMYANRTYTTSNTASRPNLFLALHSRITPYGTTVPVDVTSVALDTTAALTSQTAYPACPGCILSPIEFPAAGLDSGVVTGTPLVAWGDDFGASMQTTSQYVQAYRTLAMGVRLRVVGLPSGAFIAPGKVYFAQVKYNTNNLPLTEQDWVLLEQQGQATHVSLEAIRSGDSKTFFATPDGPNKFDFSSSFYPAPGLAFKTNGGTALSANEGLRRFPSLAEEAAGNVTLSQCVVPYNAAPNVAGGTLPFIHNSLAMDQLNADQTTLLIVGIFGLQDGVVIEADYAHIMEFIPNRSAPSAIAAAIQLPDSNAMDAIFAAAALLDQSRARMVQVPGDVTNFFGPPSKPLFSVDEDPAGAAEARKARSALVSSVRKTRGRVIPSGRARGESFWDMSWLKRGSLGDSKGGFNWNF